MTLEELLPWLFGRTTGGIRWGLDRTEALLGALGNPHHTFRSVHIGGTNGKGSVAALAESVLRRRAGRRVGLYTSPHLVSFVERIRIDGMAVDESLLLGIAERLRPEIERTGATFFEATTAMAFGCFAELGVDLAVVEVGLGGRLDATNVVRPAAAAITNVDLEHTDLLGESLVEIAREKGGIFKPGVPAITAERRPEVQAVLRACAAEAGTSLVLLDEVARLENFEFTMGGARLLIESGTWGRRGLEIPLAGAFQARNALLAAELLGLLEPDLRPTTGELAEGFKWAFWPGRLQVHLERSTTFLLDVAHNPAGVAVLCEAIDALDLPRPCSLVAGILADKEWGEMLPPLLDRVDAAILTIPPSAPPSRRWDPLIAADVLSDRYPRLRAIPDLDRAIDRATTLTPHGTVIVTGSIHTVGDAMAHLGIRAVPLVPGPDPALSKVGSIA